MRIFRALETAFPSMRISPESGATNPATRSSVVDLPQPEGPNSTTRSPEFDHERKGIDNAPVAIEFSDAAEVDFAHGRLATNLTHRPVAPSGKIVIAMRMMQSAEMRLGAPLAMSVRIRTGSVS